MPTIQVTDNTYRDISPQVYGNIVVWTGWDGNDFEIFYSVLGAQGASSPMRITDSPYYDDSPQIYNNIVVWSGDEDGDNENEIFYSIISPAGPSEPIQITNNTYYDGSPQIYDNVVVWSGRESTYGDGEIFYAVVDEQGASSPIQITNNTYTDSAPKIYGNTVVWSAFVGGDDEIFFSILGVEGTSEPIQITSSTNSEYGSEFQIYGNTVVWNEWDGSDSEIFYSILGDQSASPPVQITDNAYTDVSPQLYGNTIVWNGSDGNGDFEIFYVSLGEKGANNITQITNNSYYDSAPKIYGNIISWRGDDNNGDIYYSILGGQEPGNPVQITNSTYNDLVPQIYGNILVWNTADPDAEIFATRITDLPTISISDVTVQVAADTAQDLSFTVTLSEPATLPVAVEYNFGTHTGDTATLGIDYEPVEENKSFIFLPGETTKEIQFTVFGGPSVNHETFEIFAKDTAYRDWFVGADVSQIELDGVVEEPYGDLGYYADAIFDDTDTTNKGFQAVGLTSDERFFLNLTNSINATIADGEAEGIIYDLGKAPVLAIRGTEQTNRFDWWSDANPYGVGWNQFQSAIELGIKTWIQEASTPENTAISVKPHITGHSLGGALTQWIAADYSAQGTLGEIVTFNSPGISVLGANSFVGAEKVTHYITSTDVVSMAGFQYVPGRYILSDESFSTFNQIPIVGVHGHPVITDRIDRYDSNKPSNLEQISFESVDGLNSPLFTYLPDPDYFIFLLVVSRIPALGSYAATALKYRGTTEAARTILGETLYTIANFDTEYAKEAVQAAWDAAQAWGTHVWNAITDFTQKSYRFLEANDIPLHWDSQIENLTLSESLEQAIQRTQSYLTSFANASDFEAQLNIAFGTDWDPTVAETLRQHWAAGDFSDIPTLEVVPADVIGGASGAYEFVNGNIYLASEWLIQNSEDIDAIAALIAEEVGHHVDELINFSDAPGDEGAIFAALVQGMALSDEDLQALRTEDDLMVVQRSTTVWDAFSQWPVAAWNASVSWSDAAWDAIAQWSDATWEATTAWTPEIWNQTTEWTDTTWNATVNSPLVIATPFDILKDHVLLGQATLNLTLENLSTVPIDTLEVEVVYSDDDIIGNADDQIVGSHTLTDLLIGVSVSDSLTVQLPQAVLNSRAQTDDPPGMGNDHISSSYDMLALVTATGDVLALDDITYFPWDIDDSGQVTPSDAIYVINRLGQTTTAENALADFDGSGQITPSDAISSINRLGYGINLGVIEALP
jgi:hypothetical protein